MSQRNSIRRALAVRFDRLSRSSFGGFSTAGLALLALGVACVMDEVNAAAASAAALALGGLLLAGALAVSRRSNAPTRWLLELRRVRMRPAHIVHHNHR